MKGKRKRVVVTKRRTNAHEIQKWEVPGRAVPKIGMTQCRLRMRMRAPKAATLQHHVKMHRETHEEVRNGRTDLEGKKRVDVYSTMMVASRLGRFPAFCFRWTSLESVYEGPPDSTIRSSMPFTVCSSSLRFLDLVTGPVLLL